MKMHFPRARGGLWMYSSLRRWQICGPELVTLIAGYSLWLHSTDTSNDPIGQETISWDFVDGRW